MDKAYHEWRAPLLINSNWWLAFYDDDLIPASARTSIKPPKGMAGATPWQLRRSAWLIHRMLEFKDRLDMYVASHSLPYLAL
jgi:carnitine O-acetyltransferase